MKLLSRRVRNLRRCHFGNKGRRQQNSKSFTPQHPRSVQFSLDAIGFGSKSFFQYVQQLTVLDLVLIRRLHTLNTTDIDHSSAPAAVQVFLCLGDKFVSHAKYNQQQLRNSLQAFLRKVRLRLHFDNQARHAKQPRKHSLPCLRLPSTFNPQAHPSIEQHLQHWAQDILISASNIAASSYEQEPFYAKKARTWLQQHNLAGTVCKLAADKNYGPVLVSQARIKQQYLSELSSGSYTEVCTSDLMWDFMHLFSYLDVLTEAAVMRSYFDRPTRDLILHDFRALRLGQPTHCDLASILGKLGRLRYLIKLHKPGLALRRVEVDVRSPLNNLSLWASRVLGRVARACKTVVQDSKDVLVSLDHPPAITDDLLFVAADLEDFYPRIDIPSLKKSLLAAIKRFFGNQVGIGDFVCKIINVCLNHKYVRISGRIFKKARSLSIGERIATDAANIHREEVFGPYISRAFESGFMTHFWGYVDDTAAICHSSIAEVMTFYDNLNAVDPQQFHWKIDVLPNRLVFLDLCVEVHDGVIETFTHVKPGHNPQYLHALSDHPMSCKRGIFRSQCMRFLINNSTESGFNRDVCRLRVALSKRLYPSLCMPIPAYDVEKRTQFLDRMRSRTQTDNAVANSGSDDRIMIFTMPFNTVTRRLNIGKKWKSLQSLLADDSSWASSSVSHSVVRVAYRIDANTFFENLSAKFRAGIWVGGFCM